MITRVSFLRAKIYYLIMVFAFDGIIVDQALLDMG